jgi:hypothetical protein
VLVFGIWIRYVVNQQLKLKDVTIESKNAEISRLKGEAAPNIVKSYQSVKKYADEVSGQANELRERLDAAELRKNFRERGQPLRDMVNETAGLIRSIAILENHTSALFERANPPSTEEALTAIIAGMRDINKEVDAKSDVATKLLKAF